MGVVAKRAAHVTRNEARFTRLDPDLAAPAQPTAWDRANRAVLSRHVDDALRALTAGERDVITMRFRNGLSIEQIAAQRKTAPQTVKELERRGLRKLCAELAAYRSDHDPVAEGS
jgi:RNA polymerase sigma factor (sigma-70 family)